MDVKKSPEVSLEGKKMLYVLMGLAMVLSLIYIAFEWTDREVEIYEITDVNMVVEEEIEIIQTAQELPPPPPPPAPEIVEIIDVVEDDVVVENIEVETEDQDDKPVDLNVSVSTGEYGDGEEGSDVPFVIVEKMPSFPGGPEALNKYLADNIQYPYVAIDNNIQGRVVCQFVVNRDGSIVDIVVVRSVHSSLDKEAVRVIQSMPRWTPGLQRGKTVRVKYTLPVSFRLN